MASGRRRRSGKLFPREGTRSRTPALASALLHSRAGDFVMPRAIWKGALSFGLVTVPVGLSSATERASELHFRLLHAKDESPIDYKRVCEKEGVEEPWAEIARGYEVTKGEYVVVTDKELAQARVEATQTFAIR